MRRVDTLNGFHRAVAGSNEKQTAKLLDLTEPQLTEAFKIADKLTAVFRMEDLGYKLFVSQEFTGKKTRS